MPVKANSCPVARERANASFGLNSAGETHRPTTVCLPEGVTSQPASETECARCKCFHSLRTPMVDEDHANSITQHRRGPTGKWLFSVDDGPVMAVTQG